MKYWRLSFLIIFISVIGLTVNLAAEELAEQEQQQVSALARKTESYWKKIQKKADELYSGIDIEFKVEGGLEKKNSTAETTGAVSGPYADLKLTVPLYSKKDRISMEEKKQEYLNKGAQLLKELEVSEKMVYLLRHKAQIMRAFIKEEGIKSAESYYEIKEEIALKESCIKEIERKIQAMLK